MKNFLAYSILIFSVFGFSSCEVCYECTYTDTSGMVYTEERCDTKDRIETFVDNNKELGWECKKK